MSDLAKRVQDHHQGISDVRVKFFLLKARAGLREPPETIVGHYLHGFRKNIQEILNIQVLLNACVAYQQVWR